MNIVQNAVSYTHLIASVCGLLAENGVNILDISQTILQEYFTMIMLVDTSKCSVSFAELANVLKEKGEESCLSIRCLLYTSRCV